LIDSAEAAKNARTIFIDGRTFADCELASATSWAAWRSESVTSLLLVNVTSYGDVQGARAASAGTAGGRRGSQHSQHESARTLTEVHGVSWGCKAFIIIYI
jgi:hypothetical protein